MIHLDSKTLLQARVLWDPTYLELVQELGRFQPKPLGTLLLSDLWLAPTAAAVACVDFPLQSS